jgi:hypothetical protein
VKKVAEVGRFSICENRGALHMRWWDKVEQKTKSKRLEATTLGRAREEVKVLARDIVDPSERVSERSRAAGDPTFGECWLYYERAKKETLSEGRFRLLKNRLALYYRPSLWDVPMSRMGPELIRFAGRLREDRYSRRRGRAREGATPEDSRQLHPNTIADIIQAAIGVCEAGRANGLTTMASPAMPAIPGRTLPHDRAPKGRYLTFAEMGKLIDAAVSEHVLDLLLLELGSGARIGSVGGLEACYVHRALGVIDLGMWGSIETNKRRPLGPISGPMGRTLDRLIERHPNGVLIRDKRGRSSAPSAGGAGNYTQVIQRLVERSRIDEKLKPGALSANWYSIRRTLSDFLDGRVRAASISSVLGHYSVPQDERRKLFEDGSPMTLIYKRRKLEPVHEVGRVLEADWWPAIQPHTHLDLSSSPACREALSPELMLTDAEGVDTA